MMEKLLAVMQELRAKCPWDQAQTPMTLSRYAIEEAYEVEAAIQSGNALDVCDELGDLLLQVVFQAQIYSEQGLFDFQDVVNAITEKMIRRHPHVFRSDEFAQLSKEQVTQLWQQIKQQEKQGKTVSLLDSIKPGPALPQSEGVQKVAAQLGFDFPTVQEAYGKLEEELEELKVAIQRQQSDEIQEEFGDCLFSLINVGRKLGCNSEMALLGTIHKFKTRFAYIEQQAKLQNQSIEELSLEEMDRFWDQAKQLQRKKNNEQPKDFRSAD